MRKRILIAIVLLLVSLIVTAGAGLAQTSAHYNLEWHVIGGGGEPVSSADYVVNSTAGQGAASPPTSASASYVVCAGYWCGNFLTLDHFLPLTLKRYP
jgi:hypothetical protein